MTVDPEGCSIPGRSFGSRRPRLADVAAAADANVWTLLRGDVWLL
jgi:hypothetical protein